MRKWFSDRTKVYLLALCKSNVLDPDASAIDKPAFAGRSVFSIAVFNYTVNCAKGFFSIHSINPWMILYGLYNLE